MIRKEEGRGLRADELWDFAARLKVELRRGWIRAGGIERIESVADHSFGVAILSFLEAVSRGYDVRQTLILALIHDFEEGVTGDLTPEDRGRLSKKQFVLQRDRARSRILKAIPRSERTAIRELWRDLDGGRTKEARLVKDLDKLEMALQARRYEKMGASRATLEKFLKSAVDRIADRSIRERARSLAAGKI